MQKECADRIHPSQLQSCHWKPNFKQGAVQVFTGTLNLKRGKKYNKELCSKIEQPCNFEGEGGRPPLHADCATDRPLCRKFSLRFRRLLRRACEIQELRAGTRLRSQGRTSSSLSQCANRSNFTCREHSSPIGREGSSRAHLANPYTVQTFGIRMRIATGGMRGANARFPMRYFMQMRLI